MSTIPQKLIDLRNFYENVRYYVNKGGRDGMAELSQHYKTLAKIYKIRIPKIVKLLEAHLDNNPVNSKHISHLEHGAMLLAETRSMHLNNQINKLQSRDFSKMEEKRGLKIKKILSPVCLPYKAG